MTRCRAVLTALALTGSLIAARADDYPARPVMLVVPFPPGGSTTIMARIVGDRMAAAFGQQFVIENRGGAGGTVATRATVKSPPDGYTILLSYTGTFAIGPSLYPDVGYDPRKDFAPIGLIAAAPTVLVVHPSIPAHTVAELVALIRANPGKYNFGSPGVGTVNHVTGELLATTAGLKMTHVPYKGSGPAVTDLLGGHISFMFSPIPAVIGNIKAGSLRALAVTSPKRTGLLPDVPTVAESGLPGFEAELRYGLVAPLGTPRPIIDRLNREMRAALATDEVRTRLATEGAEPLPSTPEEYAADIDRDETKWSKVVKASGAKAE